MNLELGVNLPNKESYSFEAEKKAYAAHREWADNRLSDNPDIKHQYTRGSEVAANRMCAEMNNQAGCDLFYVTRKGNEFQVVSDPSRVGGFARVHEAEELTHTNHNQAA